MVERPPLQDVSTETPKEFPGVTPRDLYPTSDIRFVMMEIGKLTSSVDRLIADVKSQGEKIDDLRHKVSFIKGAWWALAGALGLTILLLTKWATVLKIAQAVSG